MNAPFRAIRVCFSLALLVGLLTPWGAARAQGLGNGSACQGSWQCQSLTCVDLLCCVEGGGLCGTAWDAGCCQDNASLQCLLGICGIATCGTTTCGQYCSQNSDCQVTSGCSASNPPWSAFCGQPWAKPTCGYGDGGPGCNACLIDGTDTDAGYCQQNGIKIVCPSNVCCSQNVGKINDSDTDLFCCSTIGQSCGTNTDCCGGNISGEGQTIEESCGPTHICCGDLNFEGCSQNSDCCGNYCEDAGFYTFCATQCQYVAGSPY